MKQFFTALLALILVFAGIWIYDDVSGRKLHEFLGVNNVAMNIGDSSTNDNSGYRLNVTSNLGTVIDYVDYETISDEEYEIETEGFNRQFCELSIYNTETEEQLQNNSVIEIDDELQINLAIPEGYRLNAFFINGYYADFSELITVTGNAEIYIDIERISVIFKLTIYDPCDPCYNPEGCSNTELTILSDEIVKSYEIKKDNFDYLVSLYYVYYGDIITFSTTSSLIDVEPSRAYFDGYKYPPLDGYSIGEGFFEFFDYEGSELEVFENSYVFMVEDWYMLDFHFNYDY